MRLRHGAQQSLEAGLFQKIQVYSVNEKCVAKPKDGESHHNTRSNVL